MFGQWSNRLTWEAGVMAHGEKKDVWEQRGKPRPASGAGVSASGAGLSARHPSAGGAGRSAGGAGLCARQHYPRIARRFIIAVCALSIALTLLADCAGHGAVGAALVRPALTVGEPLEAPTTLQLQQLLTSELKRLGKSPSDVTPHAPTGATNAAFDLAASVIDPDGPPDGEGGGALPPTGIELTWTERFIGDYSMDGQVNVQDLTPLGINWERTVAYDAPALHGGVAYWPTGVPLDDGGSVYPDPPATTSGAANWRKARVDGKEDGVLNAQDVTPIAVHWMEQSAGYRVYAKLPGETAFHVLPNPDDAASPLTIPRSKLYPPGHTTMDSTRPVCFSFTKTANGGHSGPPHGDETIALPEGRYEFYVTAYDPASNADGPASAHVALDITGGIVNQIPVAKLSLSPSFAGAPAVITLDASLSSDPDGSIVEYQWDFDGDGAVDWSTADAVPVSCCGGEVDTITPGAGTPPATVTVNYEHTAGYADYLYPRVTVVDDEGAINARSAKLGVTGWEIVETMYSNKDEFNPPGDELLICGDYGIDPNSDNLVVAGGTRGYISDHPEFLGADMYWQRVAPGEWEYEYIRTADQLLPDGMGGTLKTVLTNLFWDESGQPMVVLCYYQYGYMDSLLDWRTYLARRKGPGVWELSVLFAGTQPDDAKGSRGAYPIDIVQPALGELHVLFDNTIAPWEDGAYCFNYQYVSYKNGVAHTEPIGIPDPEAPVAEATAIMLNSDGEPCVFIRTLDYSLSAILWRRRTAPGIWVTEQLDNGELDPTGDGTIVFKAFLNKTNSIVLGAYTYIIVGENEYLNTNGICYLNSNSVSFHPIRTDDNGSTPFLVSTAWGYSFTSALCPRDKSKNIIAYHDLVQSDGSVISEIPMSVVQDGNSFCWLDKVLPNKQGQLYSVLHVAGGPYPGAEVDLLVRRVDPRGTP
jgi:hypothetical protein